MKIKLSCTLLTLCTISEMALSLPTLSCYTSQAMLSFHYYSSVCFLAELYFVRYTFSIEIFSHLVLVRCLEEIILSLYRCLKYQH